VRQQLPASAGYPLVVPGVGVVSPGDPPFDAESPVPGCELLDEEQSTKDGSGDKGGTSAPQDQAAGKGRTQGKGAGL
jgi:hypothetical protein